MGIFISYSHADTQEIVKIVELLKSSTDQDIWFDHELRGGDHYFSIIANQILKNEYFVFVVSDNSVSSDWCIHELEFAMAEKRKIIAIWLDNINIPAQVKFIIQNTHYINWYGTGSERFKESISKCFSGEASVLNTKAQEISENDERSSLRAGKKYFVTDKEIIRIQHLLELESKNIYSECFKPENAVYLGLAYELGIKTERDEKKAELYYKAGMFKGSSDASYLYAAFMADRDPDCIENYLAMMKDAAEKGSVIAMTHYGDICYDGSYGVPKDMEKAVELWKKAADAGSPAAQYYMAFMFRNGIGVEKDPGISLMYALSSMEYEFPRAYRNIAFLYEYGEFVDKDLEKAKEYFKKAIDLGDHLSLCYLGGIYKFDEGNNDESVKCYKQAVEYANEGKIKSGIPYFRMGQSYLFGTGVEKDLELSVKYYLQAAERNHKKAKSYVVSNIRNLEDDEKKLSYLLQASEYNCDGADYYIGTYYYDKKDMEKAKEYYILGAQKGDVFCIQVLISKYYGRVFADENTRDRTLALKYFRLLFSLAGADTLNILRDVEQLSIYYYGYALELDYDLENGKPDTALALHYYAKSLETDHQMINNIIFFAVRGFLFPEESRSGLPHDVIHSEEILDIIYKEICLLENGERKLYKELGDDILGYLVDGHRHIAGCYKTGRDVQKNREKKEYHDSVADYYADIRRSGVHKSWVKAKDQTAES